MLMSFTDSMPTSSEKSPVHAGFWVRAYADFLDSLLLNLGAIILLAMTLACVYWMRRSMGHPDFLGPKSFYDSLDPLTSQIWFGIFRVGLSAPYFICSTVMSGTTVGKKVFGVYVVSAVDESPVSLKQSFARYIGYLISYIFVGAGFLMVAFHPEKKGLHDLIAGTVSVKKANKAKGRV